jgi:hypothetical protein
MEILSHLIIDEKLRRIEAETKNQVTPRILVFLINFINNFNLIHLIKIVQNKDINLNFV